MATWQPQEAGLQQLMELLVPLRDPTHPHYSAAMQRLSELHASGGDDLPLYLVYVLARTGAANGVLDEHRQLAGLILLQHLRLHFGDVSASGQAYLRDALLEALGDPAQVVRLTAGNVLPLFATCAGPAVLGPVFPPLFAMLDSDDVPSQDAALDALRKICEDAAPQLSREAAALGSPLSSLVPRCLHFFRHPEVHLRDLALQCLAPLLLVQPAALLQEMQAYIVGLGSLAFDPSPTVRHRVCDALVVLTELRLDLLAPAFADILQFMLAAVEDADDTVAKEACEFFNVLCERPGDDPATGAAIHQLTPLLPRLVPKLLKNMRYAAEDVARFLDTQIDANEPDRAEDLRPAFRRPRRGDEGEAPEAGEVAPWTLRRAAASALDHLARQFPDPTWHALRPCLEQQWGSDDPWEGEAATLGLGACAAGGFAHLGASAGQLLPSLVQQLQHPIAQVRETSCWAVSLFMRALCNPPTPPELLSSALAALGSCAVDGNKKVQESACAAICRFEEVADLARLSAALEGLVNVFTAAFRLHQTRARMALHDAVATLADALGPELGAQPLILSALLGPLVADLQRASHSDAAFFSLVECLTAVAAAAGSGLQDFAVVIFQRGTMMLAEALLQTTMEPEELRHGDVAAAVLNLLGGLTDALGPGMASLISDDHHRLLGLALECMRADDAGIRQAAFGLAGSLARHCGPVLARANAVEAWLPALLKGLDATEPVAAHNASWALGELISGQGGALAPRAPDVAERLLHLLGDQRIPIPLWENVSITLGRLGMVDPAVLASRLEAFAPRWLEGLWRVRDPRERVHAFAGLCRVAAVNPEAVLNTEAFPRLLVALASWRAEAPPPQELATNLRDMLMAYRRQLDDRAWAALTPGVPFPLLQHLGRLYGLEAFQGSAVGVHG